MKRLAITIALVLFVISVPVHAKSPTQNETIDQLVNEVAEAYEAKDLGRLDSKKPYVGKIKIIMQHSLSDGPGEFVVKWVKSLGQAEAWLKSREIDELPGRETRPSIKCAKGVCTYNFDGGILHNTLYLKKITYGVRKGRPYIKTILLLNGD
jgi:hypothetical protein